MFDELKTEVCRVNRALVESGLVILTWGNASGIDRKSGVMAIKPSGVGYNQLKPQDMVLIKISNGAVIEGDLRPSTDTPTHLHLYRAFPNIGGVVHTHSQHATAWAQAGRDLPCFGTTHADHFCGAVPIIRYLTQAEIEGDYEAHTAAAIKELFRRRRLSPDEVPGVLLQGHAPFTWGRTPQAALENAIALERSAQLASEMLTVNSKVLPLPEALLKQHFHRKNGSNAVYGQRTTGDSPKHRLTKKSPHVVKKLIRRFGKS